MSTRATPAGDFDYETAGDGYARVRQPDPRIAAQIDAALGDARSVVNVGAGAGSYEPTGRTVIPVEPSASMRAQRPAPTAGPRRCSTRRSGKRRAAGPSAIPPRSSADWLA